MSLNNYRLHSLKDQLNEEALEEAKRLAEKIKKETKEEETPIKGKGREKKKRQ